MAPIAGSLAANFDGAIGVPAPTLVTVADMQDGSAVAEQQESMLVQLSNVQFSTPGGAFAGSMNYNVTDGVQTAIVRVGASTNSLVGMTIPSGLLNIIGVISQFDSTSPFDGGYQLQLLGVDSLQAVPEPSTICLMTFGGAAMALTLARRIRSRRAR